LKKWRKFPKVRKKFIRKKIKFQKIPKLFCEKRKETPPPPQKKTHMLYKIQVFIIPLFFENRCCYFFDQEIGFIWFLV